MLRVAAGALLVAATLAGTAHAHPLGNGSVNHLTYVKVFPDRVSLLYVLDQAEYPTLRDLHAGTPRELFSRKLDEVRRRVSVTVDGRPGRLELNPNPTMRFRRGQVNLYTVRITLPVIVRVDRPARVVVRDDTFAGQGGLTLVVALGAPGTAVRRLDGPIDDPSRGLYLLPPGGQYEDRRAELAVGPGAGTVAGTGTRPAADGFNRGARGGDAFTRLFDRATAGEGMFVVLLLAAFAWGALHALSPGHGKGMVAAYLIGTRGSALDAVALGAIVTVTHTAGVFALGLAFLALTQYLVPEDVYPWLNLAAGLLIVGVGLGVLRSRVRWGRRQRALVAGAKAEHAGHEHAGHEHARHEHAGHEHARHEHAGHEHAGAGGHHDHHGPAATGWRGRLAMGVSAGLVPCPSALVVLLGAVTQHRVGLGMILIVAFSLGLAVTLTALGLALVWGARAAGRLPRARRLASSRLGAALPALSTVLILVVGVVLTMRALPGVT